MKNELQHMQYRCSMYHLFDTNNKMMYFISDEPFKISYESRDNYVSEENQFELVIRILEYEE